MKCKPIHFVWNLILNKFSDRLIVSFKFDFSSSLHWIMKQNQSNMSDARYFCLRKCMKCRHDFSSLDSYRGPRVCPRCGAWVICRNIVSWKLICRWLVYLFKWIFCIYFFCSTMCHEDEEKWMINCCA